MKSENAESQKQLPTAPVSAEINDFLYVDRARISALYAQLFPQGVLTGIRTTTQQNFSDEGGVGSDIKIFKASTKTIEAGSEGIEHQFDASWSIPLEVLAKLESLSLVRNTLLGAGLGSIILTDCHLRIVDFSSMANLWTPALNAAALSGEHAQLSPGLVTLISDGMKAMPQAIHAHFLTAQALLWASLHPLSLTISTSDLTLKYGGIVSGQWKLLYILDAWADKGEIQDLSGWSAGPMIDAVLTALQTLRTMVGRPPGWAGITPLMIYRGVSGWLPNTTPSATD